MKKGKIGIILLVGSLFIILLIYGFGSEETSTTQDENMNENEQTENHSNENNNNNHQTDPETEASNENENNELTQSENDNEQTNHESDHESENAHDNPVSVDEAEQIVKDHLIEDEGFAESDFEFYSIHYDHEEDGQYKFQVFESLGEGENSHSSTYNWYVVDTETGEIEAMF